MKELNFQKIIDTIAEAFNIFDFSFIVSGGITYLIILVFLLHEQLFVLPSTGFEITLFIISSILTVYVLGLVSWSIGKYLRKRFMFFEKDRDNSLKNIYDGFKIEKDAQAPKISSEYFDTYAWTKLISLSDSNNKGISNRLSFLNRMWVMQAVCEGLMGSCSCAIIALGYIIYEDFPNGENSSYETVVIEALVILAIIIVEHLLSSAAKSYARTKIKDIFVAYYLYVDEHDRVDIKFKERDPNDVRNSSWLKRLKDCLCKKLCGCDNDK